MKNLLDRRDPGGFASTRPGARLDKEQAGYVRVHEGIDIGGRGDSRLVLLTPTLPGFLVAGRQGGRAHPPRQVRNHGRVRSV